MCSGFDVQGIGGLFHVRRDLGPGHGGSRGGQGGCDVGPLLVRYWGSNNTGRCSGLDPSLLVSTRSCFGTG